MSLFCSHRAFRPPSPGRHNPCENLAHFLVFAPLGRHRPLRNLATCRFFRFLCRRHRLRNFNTCLFSPPWIAATFSTICVNLPEGFLWNSSIYPHISFGSLQSTRGFCLRFVSLPADFFWNSSIYQGICFEIRLSTWGFSLEFINLPEDVLWNSWIYPRVFS